jgi:hypothetical protein
MVRSKSNLKSGRQAFARAFLLAWIFAGVLGITRGYAARSTTHAAEAAAYSGPVACAAGMQSSDFYLHQEEAVLRKVTQSSWNAAELASLSGSNVCAAGMQSSDDYLRQEQAILSIVTQGNWNAARMGLPGGSIAIIQESH